MMALPLSNILWAPIQFSIIHYEILPLTVIECFVKIQYFQKNYQVNFVIMIILIFHLRFPIQLNSNLFNFESFHNFSVIL